MSRGSAASPGSARPRFPAPPPGFRWRTLAPPAAHRGSRSGGNGPPPGITVLQAAGFGVTHGFTARFRGPRPGARPLGRREELTRDLERLAPASGAGALHPMRQVHGKRVLLAGGGETPRDPLPEGDGMVVRRPGAGVLIRSADCVPILFSDPHSGAAAGAHAGWRGTLAGVAAGTVRVLVRETGAPPRRLNAVLGPAIGPCCFEVGPEVVEAFAAAGRGPERFVVEGLGERGRPHLDLLRANRLQLAAAGLRAARIRTSGLCTRCHPAFHSYRRAGGPTGSNFAFAVAGSGERG